MNDNTSVIDAMRLVVQWETMTTYCMSKKGCRDCPYNKKQVCNKMSTETMLKKVAKIFDKFLKKEVEIE
jgi:hypothetical protein